VSFVFATVLRVAEARSSAPCRRIRSPSAALEPRRLRGTSPLTSRACARHPGVIRVANGAPQHLNPVVPPLVAVALPR
jgi:hypothetical protein